MEKISIVGKEENNELKKLLDEYLVEIAKFDNGVKFNKKGEPVYKWFDLYFKDKDRFPFYYIIDGGIAGFALVRELENKKYEIAEFCILDGFRGNGNASKFAKMLCDYFDGQMEFSTNLKNQNAVKFWSKFVKGFEYKEFDEGERRNWIIMPIANEHTLGLREEYYNLVKSGEKTIEGRLFDEKRQKYNVGDYICFCKEPKREEKIKAVILDKLEYKSFKDLIKGVGVNVLGFKNQTPKQVEQIYKSIYSTENEQKYGVVGIKIMVIKF